MSSIGFVFTDMRGTSTRSDSHGIATYDSATFLPRNLRAARSYAFAAASSVWKVPRYRYRLPSTRPMRASHLPC